MDKIAFDLNHFKWRPAESKWIKARFGCFQKKRRRLNVLGYFKKANH